MIKRVVIDTNILISAALTRSAAAVIVNWAFDNAVILGSLETIGEFQKTLMRPKFNKYISIEAREEAIRGIVSHVQLVAPNGYPQIQRSYCRDPKDDKFFQLALAGHADWLISGDKDILEADSVNGVCVLTAQQALEKIKEERK